MSVNTNSIRTALYCPCRVQWLWVLAESRASPGLLVLAQAEFVLDWGDGHQKINEPYWSVCVAFISIITHRLLMGGGEGFCGPIFLSRSHLLMYTYGHTPIFSSQLNGSQFEGGIQTNRLFQIRHGSVQSLALLESTVCSGFSRVCLGLFGRNAFAYKVLRSVFLWSGLHRNDHKPVYYCLFKCCCFLPKEMYLRINM